MATVNPIQRVEQAAVDTLLLAWRVALQLFSYRLRLIVVDMCVLVNQALALWVVTRSQIVMLTGSSYAVVKDEIPISGVSPETQTARTAMTYFTNREHAARELSERLERLNLSNPVILGIPRGGIPIAVTVARHLPHAEVGVIVARKLGAPGNPELAIGAVSANGAYVLDEPLARGVGASEQYIENEIRSQQAEARRREEQFDGNRRPALRGRNVIVVDDGVATGATAIAAIRAAKTAGARYVCFAVPVGPSHTIRELRSEADDVVCLHQPEQFWAVGQFYRHFDAVEDDEARRLFDSVEVSPELSSGASGHQDAH